MEPKVRGIVAYVTVIGWIVAVVTNNPKDGHASFHIRQMLGLMLVAAAIGAATYLFGFLPVLGWLISVLSWIVLVVLLIFWVIGFIGALQGEQRKVPLLGDVFQSWFSAL